MTHTLHYTTRTLVFTFILMVLTSCVKEPMPTVDDSVKPKKRVQWIWEADLAEYSKESQLDPILYKDWVIVGLRSDHDSRNVPVLIAFNKYTGDIVWEFNYPGKRTEYASNIIIQGDKIIIKYADRLICVDADTREMLWESIYPSNIRSDHPMVSYGDYLYQEEEHYEDESFTPFNDSVQLVRYHLPTGHMEKLWGERKVEESGNHPLVNPPVVFNGSRELVIFTKRYFHFSLKPHVEKYAIDVKTKEVVWRDSAYSHVADAWNTPPIIFEGHVIASSDWTLYCWNAETGVLKWKTELNDMEHKPSFTISGPFLHENSIFSISNNGKMFCLDARTGSMRWQVTSVGNSDYGPAGSPCNRPIVVGDILYVNSWTNRALMLFDANTGRQLERHRQHRFNGNNVLYDEDMKTFFVTADDKLLSFKVNNN